MSTEPATALTPAVALPPSAPSAPATPMPSAPAVIIDGRFSVPPGIGDLESFSLRLENMLGDGGFGGGAPHTTDGR